MTSIIKLNALSGALDESPHCYLLYIDELRILLDCGWDENFNQDFIKELKRHINQIDAVLLSYPDPLHLGALPYLVGKCGLTCPVYATVPVYKMGQMFMYDLYQSRCNTEDFDLFTLDDVDAAFEKIVQLKYNETVSMKGKGYGVTLTPLPAGHMIGGTIWKIVKDGKEDIIYAVDINHQKERHLNGCELKRLHRPSLLITDSFNASYRQPRRRERDEKLMTQILLTLRRGGNVLVSVDTAGRVLELAHMLDQLWRSTESGLLAYSLAQLNNVSYNVTEFAKSQIEWMSDRLAKQFEEFRINSFQFKHLQLCHTITDLYKVSSPMVVLASTPDMESGFSRELFLQWCSNPQNSIIITSRTSPGTLARDLVENGGNRNITLAVKKKVRLTGAELKEYKKKKIQEQEQEQMKQDRTPSSEAANVDVESEDEVEFIVNKNNSIVKRNPKCNMFRQNKAQHLMFPFVEEKIKFDEYGEIIDPEDYRIAEELPKREENKENIVADSKVEEQHEYVETEIPTKCVSTTRTIAVNASVTYVDFEGRSDSESLEKIVVDLKPQRLIVVRGSAKDAENLARRASSVGTRVFVPSKGEILDATIESHIYQVRLTDALLRQFKFTESKDLEVAWVDAIMTSGNQVCRDVVVDNENEDSIHGTETILSLEPLPLDEIPEHEPMCVEVKKLSDMRRVLNKVNISSIVRNGVLYCCNDTIAIRRHSATGKFVLEGAISNDNFEDYYKVREIFYKHYKVL